MQTVIGVRFKQAGKIYYFSPGALSVEVGNRVVVETSRGIECGSVVLAPREVEENPDKPLRTILRIATEEDFATLAENERKAKEAMKICEEKIAAHGLAMKLVNVEYAFDGHKILFYFTADGRVDFRGLVKDLASVFRTRIELRQIGVRDEAKLMGGVGGCGRPLCCATFLGDFEPVSIRMAKEQNLSLNPTKISGICGRLMCCLKYESECYCGGGCCGRKAKPAVKEPAQGSRVVTVEGDGKVISTNGQRRTATILLDNHRTIVASWEDVIEKSEDEGDIETLEAQAAQEEESAMETALESSEEDGSARSDRSERQERPERRNRPDRSGSRPNRERPRSGSPRDSRKRREGEGARDFRSKDRQRRPKGQSQGGERRSRDRRPRERGPRRSEDSEE